MDLITYGIIGKELGERHGTMRLKGYVQLNEPLTIKAFQKVLIAKGIKCTLLLGTRDLQSTQKFCKTKGVWEEWGNPTPKRTAHWQEPVIAYLRKKDCKQYIWVVETRANKPKEYFLKYIKKHLGAIVFKSGNLYDYVFNYEKEPIIVFDYMEQEESKRLYELISILEQSKPPGVVVLSKWKPDLRKISDDVWRVLVL